MRCLTTRNWHTSLWAHSASVLYNLCYCCDVQPRKIRTSSNEWSSNKHRACMWRIQSLEFSVRRHPCKDRMDSGQVIHCKFLGHLIIAIQFEQTSFTVVKYGFLFLQLADKWRRSSWHLKPALKVSNSVNLEQSLKWLSGNDMRVIMCVLFIHRSCVHSFIYSLILVIAYPFAGGLEPILADIGRRWGTLWTSCQLITGLTLTFSCTGNLESSINITSLDCGRKPEYHPPSPREPTQTQGEHANFTQKGLDVRILDSGPGFKPMTFLP